MDSRSGRDRPGWLGTLLISSIAESERHVRRAQAVSPSSSRCSWPQPTLLLRLCCAVSRADPPDAPKTESSIAIRVGKRWAASRGHRGARARLFALAPMIGARDLVAVVVSGHPTKPWLSPEVQVSEKTSQFFDSTHRQLLHMQDPGGAVHRSIGHSEVAASGSTHDIDCVGPALGIRDVSGIRSEAESPRTGSAFCRSVARPPAYVVSRAPHRNASQHF